MKLFMYKNDGKVELALALEGVDFKDMESPGEVGTLYIGDDNLEYGTGPMSVMLTHNVSRSLCYDLDLTMAELNDILLEVAIKKREERK